jgi:tetratricopeptide (TPR) repeat protein
MIRKVRLAAIAVLAPSLVSAIELDTLWDFRQPAVSEARFREALKTASGDDALILQTQIARTYMLRGEFGAARNLLAGIQAPVQAAGAEARARYWLEWGRSYVSHRHPAHTQTPEAVQIARDAYTRALQIAEGADLDALAIDVVHMFAFVDPAPARQLEWNQKALAMVEASGQAEARKWEPSVRSNLGEAFYDLGRYEEALQQFELALALFKQRSDEQAVRIGYWHVARTLRALGRNNEALAIQLRLEREFDAAGEPRRYVFEELEILYRAERNAERTRYYADRIKASQ